MPNWQLRCEKRCRKIVMRNPFCEKCGLSRSRLALHHGILQSSQRYILNPFLWYDPTIQFCLCETCHLYGPDAPHAPHGGQDAFEKAMGRIDPLKIERLREVNSKPILTGKGIDPRKIDWEKVYGNIEQHGRPIGNEIFEGMA